MHRYQCIASGYNQNANYRNIAQGHFIRALHSESLNNAALRSY